jgi:periplasmic divalent cation tolerance protein
VAEQTSSSIFEIQTTTDELSASLVIRDRLVESNLTPCVKIQPGCQSTYFWEGAWRNAQEHVLTALVPEAYLEQLVSIIKSAHNYTNPEIIARRLTVLSSEYASWIHDSLAELQARQS